MRFFFWLGGPPLFPFAKSICKGAVNSLSRRAWGKMRRKEEEDGETNTNCKKKTL